MKTKETNKMNETHAIKEIDETFMQCESSLIIAGWNELGWTVEEVKRCCYEYTEATKEDMSFGEIEEAIYDSNTSGGLSFERQSYFFMAWKIARSITN